MILYQIRLFFRFGGSRGTPEFGKGRKGETLAGTPASGKGGKCEPRTSAPGNGGKGATEVDALLGSDRVDYRQHYWVGHVPDRPAPEGTAWMPVGYRFVWPWVTILHKAAATMPGGGEGSSNSSGGGGGGCMDAGESQQPE